MLPLQVDISSMIAAAQDRLVKSEPYVIEYADKLALKNNKLPPSLAVNPINIYALWKREQGKTWELMYIGQRSFESGWPRVREHLFHKHPKTQSKLAKVRIALESGAEIGVTGILVQPDSMRLAIEEELICRNSQSAQHLVWNLKARAKIAKVGKAEPTLGQVVDLDWRRMNGE